MVEPSTTSHRNPGSHNKHAEEATGNNKMPQSSVISIYRAKIGGAPRMVTVVWSKNLINHSLSVSIEKFRRESPLTCKVDLKPWPFRSKKGSKSFDVGGKHVDISWNFRLAKFSDGAEPSQGYFVALVCDQEVVLLLGDRKKKAYKETRSRPSLEDATLVSKKENVMGKKCFSARARFEGGRSKEHDIIVVNSISEHKEPEMWISVDGLILVHVNNLQWKFRGNETVWVEQVPVQVFWDVHDWLFTGPGSAHALFTFRPGLPAPARASVENEPTTNDSGCEDTESSTSLVSSGGGGSPEFCFILDAWKMD